MIAQLARTALRTNGTKAFAQTLTGKSVLISAGGTQENIDPVRYIGNRSSGKQGYALGDIAAQRGAKVTIVAGATDELEPPSGAEVVKVGSTREMRQAMVDRAPDADVVIMAAAVADFRPEAEANTKLKKGQADDALSTIRLTENPDILKDLVDLSLIHI